MLLILYHTGMGYVGPEADWGWHVKNPELSEGLQWFMTLLNQWRLPLLFVVSGCGVFYALRSRTPKQFMQERFTRLFWPILFGMLGVIVPIQVYVERIFRHQFEGSFFAFWPSIFTTGGYPKGNLSWHHLWFIVYLLVYSIILLPLLLYIHKSESIKAKLSNGLNNLGVLLSLGLLFILIAYTLDPIFPGTNNLTWDWANHAKYILAFMIGFCFAAADVWQTLNKHAKLLAIIAIALFVAYYTQRATYYVQQGPLREVRILCIRCAAWVTILAILGNAHKFLNKSTPFLQYANESVLPFYILHQTITVMLVYLLLTWHVLWPIKFILVAVGTFGLSWLIYHFAIRNNNIMRFVFGMKKRT